MKIYVFRIANCQNSFAAILCALFVFCVFVVSIKAQSTNQNFPTPITSNEIAGKIPARDVGDARLTNYFYVFNGKQGDIFINVVTSNFNGDLDVFTAENLKPLTKITVYADDAEKETGRVIYLRQPEKLILRIEGRSPNDDAAVFRIKFAGSFEPFPLTTENSAPEMPEVKTENQTDVRVNSVGTIIEIKPKATPKPKDTIAKNETKPEAEKPEANEEKKDSEREIAIKKKTDIEPEQQKENQKQSAPRVVITNELAAKEASSDDKDITKEKNENASETKEDKKELEEEHTSGTKVAKETIAKETKKTKKPVKAVSPSELENIKLVILFKDGARIERPMSEVLKVNVDKGILTVISKDGAIGRYSILEVAKMTIE